MRIPGRLDGPVALLLLLLALGAGWPSAGRAAVPAIAAGADRTCAISSTLGAYCWGNNESGSLGFGSVVGSATPAPVVGVPSGVVYIASSGSSSHTCAVTSGGALYCWGNGYDGQLGNGTSSPSPIPAMVYGGSAGVFSVSTGSFHTCALTIVATVYCWGNNLYGVLGTGDTIPYAVPVPVQGMPEPVRAIAAGGEHTCALGFSGAVYCWGRGTGGQLGNGARADSSVPVRVAGLPATVTAITSGLLHSCALTSGGSVSCWGSNDGGQLGDGTFDTRATPVAVSGLSGGVARLATGQYHNCVVRSSGEVACWGANAFGQSGNASNLYVTTPTVVAGLPANMAGVSLGYDFTCALTSAGGVWCWGSNIFGSLATGTPGDGGPTPVPATALGVPVVSLAAGASHVCAMAASGGLLCWGGNTNFQLGRGDAIGLSAPVPVLGLSSSAVAIAVGGNHACAVTTAGAVWCWGYDGSGQLGNGLIGAVSYPVQSLLTSGATGITAGRTHTCALTSGGAVLCWGNNSEGQLGNGAPGGFSITPVAVTGLSSGVAAVRTSSRSDNTCVLTTAGGVLCWGWNFYGQLGNGSRTDSRVPVAVSGLASGVRDVATGGGHACAVTTSGGVLCWGSNDAGQLGNGSSSDATIPVAVPGLPSIVAVTAGGSHTCALAASGGVYCWGGNFYGQLGDGTANASRTPVAVTGLASDVVSLSAGRYHTCALLSGGDARCWGYNASGGLGDSTFATRSKTVVVVRENGTGSLGAGTWFLDLNPAIPKTIPGDKTPSFLALTKGNVATPIVEANTTVQFRAQDVGTTGSVYVFAVAPSDLVKASPDKAAPLVLGYTRSQDGDKAAVACVLAQLNSSGQLQAVSASSLQAYVTGVLSGQGQAVQVINGVSTANIGGATFYVGYGANAAAMLNGGLNRSVATVPATRECKPQPPQTGWWWNPAEGGRGFSIEARGNNLFYAGFLYDESGRSTWYVAAGPTSLDGSLFTGNLLKFTGGQTLAGAYRAPGPEQVVGPFTLAFSDNLNATMVWPGGTVALERFPIVPNGLSAPVQANVPESGWWWNAAESGRGYFIEWQGGTAFLAGYMYDEAGNPVWYLSSYATPDPRQFSGNWWSYANGQTLTGAYRPATQVSNNVAPLSIRFDTATTGFLTLPGNRQVPITRFRF